jgi:hypothetical protein
MPKHLSIHLTRACCHSSNDQQFLVCLHIQSIIDFGLS